MRLSGDPAPCLSLESSATPSSQKENGLTGYFISPYLGAFRDTVAPEEIEPVIPSEREEAEHAIVSRPEREQWLRPWAIDDEKRLLLELKRPDMELNGKEDVGPERKLRLRRLGRFLAA